MAGNDAWVPGPDADGRRQRLKCAGTNKKTGKPCGNWALRGQTVCKYHGGNAKQNRAAGERRWQEHRVRTALTNSRTEPAITAQSTIEDPLTEFKRLLIEVLSWKDELAAHVNDLKGELSSTDFKGAEQAHAIVEIYERSLDRAGKMLDMALKHKLWDRLAEIQEHEAEIMAGAVIRVFLALGLTGTRLDEAKAILHTELTRLTIDTQEIAA
ncbi:Mcm10/DnaG-type zinc finger protein [Rothia sp. AR01]|uniref:Mcm10/DnaG-type zinc finger protein n=1 Tax=Rothia santali TaxID=2949643 RepID=A0A9X2HKN1_9MICC|nr:Mcm10/DnaG-type zinc finger protein [Rothia santali]MCP3426013.1 Mcm10/DnaG-type zinc finger protein [Rothia santali]